MCSNIIIDIIRSDPFKLKLKDTFGKVITN
jgi:hypothetical protein